MYGGKAQNLRKLKTLDLNVPEFYEIAADNLKKLNNPKVEEQLVKEFLQWCKTNNCEVVAIRSSAEGEDSAEKSFAGQFASVMRVEGKGSFLKALRTVANSKASSTYDSKHKRVHAIVQRYIEPDMAGVLFTINPSNGRSEIVINVARGHGSKVVEGENVEVVHVDRSSGTIRFEKKESVLSEEQSKQLINLGEVVEAKMQTPQDIEWAFANNALYVLQARPITKIAHLQVWDNANIGESFPGIVMPLTFSISRRGYELVYKSQAHEAGLNWYQLEANHRTFSAMVGLFAGRMYYNLANWYKFIGLFPNNSQNQKYLDEQLQTIGDAVYLPPANYPLGYRLKFFLRVSRRSIFFGLEKKRYWHYINNAYKEYESLPKGQDLFLQLNRYSFIEQMVIPRMGRSADNDFFVLIYHGILKSKFRKWFGENSSQANDFLGALHEVVSAEQAVLLSHIADYIVEDPKAAKLEDQEDYEKLDTYLLNTRAGEFIRQYREKFLHRFAEDQKIEARNPMLSLSGFYSLIKVYQQLDGKSQASLRKDAINAEQQRNRNILSQLGTIKKIQYKILIGRLKHHLRIREHNRLLRGKAYAYLRELFIQVGESLKAHDVVDVADDVYYLDIEEIFRLVDGTGYEDSVKKIVGVRRSFYKDYEIIKPPSRFTTTGLTVKLPSDFTNLAVETKKVSKYLPGTISSPGNAEGRVTVLDKPLIPKEPFEILVVSHTDPGWTPLIALARGLVIEHGGILSHAAIVTRELGIPSIIGVEGATRLLKTGDRVRINSAKGTVELI